jgi:NAD(P)-dependent dehydrogenase (short-subunit alcohol dehydrogenase family)
LEKHTQEDVMQIDGSTALVTGANRGLGRLLAQELLARGARVYAAARNPASVDLPGVTPVTLDVTDPASVAAAADATGDVTLLVNNAGSSTGAALLDGPLADVELEMSTHYYGTLAVIRAFAPQLAAAGGGAVLNVLSALSWLNRGGRSAAYSAAKSAEWSLTNALRIELAGQGTQVTALHVGYMDTDMTRQLDVPKIDPAVVAKLAVDGLAAGAAEVLADDTSRQVQAGLAGGVTALYPQFA